LFSRFPELRPVLLLFFTSKIAPGSLWGLIARPPDLGSTWFLVCSNLKVVWGLVQNFESIGRLGAASGSAEKPPSNAKKWVFLRRSWGRPGGDIDKRKNTLSTNRLNFQANQKFWKSAGGKWAKPDTYQSLWKTIHLYITVFPRARSQSKLPIGRWVKKGTNSSSAFTH
jgi:hypothetical protein